MYKMLLYGLLMALIVFVQGCSLNEEQKSPEQAESAAFTINGENVTQKEFDTYSTLMKAADPELTDEEIKNKYIRQQVIIQEAEREGISASEEEINALNESRFSWLEKDEQAYRIIKEYVDGAGMTMDEYIEQSKIISEQAIITTKLKERIESEFTERASADGTETGETAEDYYNDHIDKLAKEAVIIEQ